MIDTHSNRPRQPGSTLSLKNTLRSLNADLGCTWHCSGNDAFGTLLTLQLLLQPEDTQVPVVGTVQKSRRHNSAPGININTSLGSGYLTPTSRSPGGPALASPILRCGYVEEPETLTHGRSQQAIEPCRRIGRGIRQEQQLRVRSSFTRDGTNSTTVSGGTKMDVQRDLLTDRRVSHRSSMEVLRLGANRLEQLKVAGQM